MAVVPDCRMEKWLWYRTAEWSRGCGTGLHKYHAAVHRTLEMSRGCGAGLQKGHVAVVPDCRMFT